MKVSLFVCAIVGVAVASNDYPGTATDRVTSARERAAKLVSRNEDWDTFRVRLLDACGLKDLRDVAPGRGNTGHCFNDFNHVACCTPGAGDVFNTADGRVKGIHPVNMLGPGIVAASHKDRGEGGSWCTCAINAGESPPQDVCHVQMRAETAFNAVWCGNKDFRELAIVDDAGNLLSSAVWDSDEGLPSLGERRANWNVFRGSKYAKGCEAE